MVKSFVVRALAASFAMWLMVLTPSVGVAQTRVVGTQFRERTIVDRTLLARGRMELALSIAGALSFGSVTPEGGEPTSQSTAYFVPSAIFGYMVTGNIEVRLSLGAQWIQQKIGGTDAQTTLSWVGAVQGLYQRDLVLGLAWYAGLGAGGFFGNRDVPVSMTSRVRYSNVGGLGQILLGLLMQPGPTLLLRGGLRGDFLFGGESPEDETVAPSTKFINTQLVFELSLGWRFG